MNPVCRTDNSILLSVNQDHPPLFTLSSDSESLPDDASGNKGDNSDGELLELKPSNILGKVKDEDKILASSGRKSLSRKVSEDKTPKKHLKKSTPTKEEKITDTVLEEKNLADSTKGKGIRMD